MAASSADTGLLHVEQRGAVALVRLDRPAKRNALNDDSVLALER